MKFSIVTPCRNAEKYIEQTIQSVLNQKTEAEVQYVVMDGLSDDGTVDILKKYDGQIDWTTEKDEYHSHAINKGFAKCDGDIFAWINADDFYEPGVFEKVRKIFEENPDVQWVAGYYRMLDADDKEIRQLHARYKHFLMRHYSYGLSLVENIFAQPSVFFRKDAFLSTGELDYTSKNRPAFDYQLWVKLGKIGKPYIVKDVFSNFRYYAESVSGSQTKALFNGELNYAKAEFKRHPFAVMLHYLTWMRNRLLYRIWKL